MARKNINLGTPPNGDDGMDARSAFEVCQENFVELYGAALPADEAQRAAARARMGLGSAATRSVMTGYLDTSATGALMPRAAFGLGAQTQTPTNNIDLNTADLPVGFYSGNGWLNTPMGDLTSTQWCYLVVENLASAFPNFIKQTLTYNAVPKRTWERIRIAGTWWPWDELVHSGNTAALPITGSLSPGTDNAASYGTAARRPTQLFAATATIGTSDAREKTPVRELTEAEYAVGLQLAREIGAYRWLEAVERKGAAAREHFGQTVQRAMEIFRDHGLDPFAYGAICYDSWEQEAVEHPAEYEQIEIPAKLDEDGYEIEPARYEQGKLIREAWTEVTLEAGDRYSWRDSELFWLICAAQQRQADELARQQADILQRLEALEQSA